MSFDAAMGAAMSLTRDVELVAALVAHLRGGVVDADIADRVAALSREAVPGVDDLADEQRQTIAGVLTSIFRQAADLIDRPERPPGWTFDDPLVLQATGRASMSVAGVLASVAPSLDGLAPKLEAGGSFCDVGTGTGWLAIAAARSWPRAHVRGIDIHPGALRLARENVNAAGLAERVALDLLDVCDLEGEFDLVWLPGPFLPADVVPRALAASHGSLGPGGWLALGIYGGPADPVAQQLADLRTMRSGGHPWTASAAIAAVEAGGFANVREVERSWQAPVRLVVGQRT